MIDLGARGRIVVRGADRKTFLHALLTNDIALLSAGTGCYAALLTPQGRMIADMNVFELGDVMLIDVSREVKDVLLQRFDQLIFSEDVQLGDVSDAWGCIAVYGPRAAAVAGGLLDADLAGFRPFQNARFERAGELVVAARRDALGLTGFLLFGDACAMPGMAQALQAAGAAALQPETVEALRVEAGEPAFLVDMGDDTIRRRPASKRRPSATRRGAFPGRKCWCGSGPGARQGRTEARRVDDRRENRAAPGSVIVGGEKEIGHVTSCVISPAIGKPIALGYVHRDFVEPGTAVSVAAGRCHAERDRDRVAVCALTRNRDSGSGHRCPTFPSPEPEPRAPSPEPRVRPRSEAAPVRHLPAEAGRRGDPRAPPTASPVPIVGFGSDVSTHLKNRSSIERSGNREGRQEFGADLDICSQFLTDLARQALLERFAGVQFAAGKLPVAAEMRAFEPARQQESPVSLDHRRRHDNPLALVTWVTDSRYSDRMDTHGTFPTLDMIRISAGAPCTRAPRSP